MTTGPETWKKLRSKVLQFHLHDTLKPLWQSQKARLNMKDSWSVWTYWISVVVSTNLRIIPWQDPGYNSDTHQRALRAVTYDAPKKHHPSCDAGFYHLQTSPKCHTFWIFVDHSMFLEVRSDNLNYKLNAFIFDAKWTVISSITTRWTDFFDKRICFRNTRYCAELTWPQPCSERVNP